MSGVNKVIIIGRLGADPELKTTNSGKNVCRLSVATSQSWNDQGGQRQERTEWHRIVAWGRLADICAEYLVKGRQLYCEGQLQTRQWENQQGQKQYTTEIVAKTIQFIGATGERQQNDAGGFQDYGSDPSFGENDEIPF